MEHTLSLLLQLIGSQASNPGPAGVRQLSEGNAGISGPYAALMAAASEARLEMAAPPRGRSSDALQGEDTTGHLLLLNVSAVTTCLWAASLADVATACGAAAGEEGAASAEACWGRFWEQARAAGRLWGQLVSQRTAAVGSGETGVPLLRHVGVCQEALTRLHQLCYLHGVRAGLCCLRPAHKASLTLSLLISYYHS